MFENLQGIILFHVDITLHISINSYTTLDLHYKVSQLIMAGEATEPKGEPTVAIFLC